MMLVNGAAVGAWTAALRGRMEVELNMFEAPSGQTERAITTRFETVRSQAFSARAVSLD